MIDNGWFSYLTYVHDLTKEPSVLETPKVVRVLMDIFSIDLPDIRYYHDIIFYYFGAED